MKELISAAAVKKRVEELGLEINSHFDGEEIIVICVLKGAFVFAADLLRRLQMPADIEFLELSSYIEGASSGKISVKKDVGVALEGKNLLIVEDIIDTGLTLQFIIDHFAAANPKSLKTCVLLDNAARRAAGVAAPDFVGFVIPDEFVVGYGLDYAGKYRTLPYIASLSVGGKNEK